MDNKDNYMQYYEEAKEEAKYDLASQIAGVLSALVPVLGIMGITFDWFTQEWIDNFYMLMIAVITLGVNIYTIIRNHYSSKEGQVQNKVLKERGLKK